MKYLALEGSAVAASCALLEDGRVLGEFFVNIPQTHSQTLLPMVEDMLKNSELSLADMDALAVAAGPGSFTGLRIGMAAVKGLAWASDKPCVPVSTLEAMAWPLAHMEGVVVCAMDARRGQVYNALFSCAGGQITRLTPDRAVGLDQLAEELRKDPRPKIVLGDGGRLCAGYLSEAGIPCRLAPPHLVMQNAVSVALEAEDLAAAGGLVPPQDLAPVYLRPPQAERLRAEAMGKK